MKALQEESVFRGEGGLKEELIELCSPRCQSAAFLTVPAGAESGQNIHHQLHARARLSTFRESIVFPNHDLFVCASSQHEQGPCFSFCSCCPEGSKENCNKTEQFSFLPFLSIQVVCKDFPGPLQYMINSPGFLLASSALTYWEYLNY